MRRLAPGSKPLLLRSFGVISGVPVNGVLIALALALACPEPARTGQPRKDAWVKTLKKYDAALASVTYSKDGKLMASGCHDNTITVWDAAAEKPLYTRDADLPRLLVLAFSPDGAVLAGAGAGVVLWDARSGRSLFRLRDETITCLAFSPDGRMFATGDTQGVVRLWEMATRKERAALRGVPAPLTSLAFSPDGKRLACATGMDDCRVLVWDVLRREKVHSLAGHQNVVWCVAYSPDGKTIASGSWDGLIRLWDADTGEELGALDEHQDGVLTLAFASQGNLLASGSSDETLRLWDLKHQEQVALAPAGGSVNALAFSPDGRTITTATGDLFGEPSPAELRTWAVASLPTYYPPPRPSPYLVKSLRGSGNEVVGLAFSPDGDHLASGGYERNKQDEGVIRLWNIYTGKVVRTFCGRFYAVWHIAFSPDGQFLATDGALGGDLGTVLIWSMKTGASVKTLKASGDENIRIVSLSFLGNTRLVTAAANIDVRVWQFPKGDWQQVLSPQDERWLDTLTLATNQKLMASAGHPMTIAVREWPSMKQVCAIPTRTYRGAQSLAFSPDGRYLAVGTYDGSVLVYDLRSGKECHCFPAHAGPVNAVTFLQNGKVIASGGEDGIINVWELSTRKQRVSISAHSSSIYTLAVSSDGSLLASCGADRRVNLWGIHKICTFRKNLSLGYQLEQPANEAPEFRRQATTAPTALDFDFETLAA